MEGSITLANCTSVKSDYLSIGITSTSDLVLEMYDESSMDGDDKPSQCMTTVAELEKMVEILPKAIQQYKEYKIKQLIDPQTPIPEIFKSE